MLRVGGAVTEMEDGFMSAEGTGATVSCDVSKRNPIVRWKVRLTINNKMV